MLTKILTILANVLINVIWGKIQLWWAKRQAEYYKKKAEVERRRKESLEAGQAAEEDIRKAGDTEVIHADKAKTWEARIEELERRARERAERHDNDEVA